MVFLNKMIIKLSYFRAVFSRVDVLPTNKSRNWTGDLNFSFTIVYIIYIIPGSDYL